MTVSGKIPANELGVSLIHEHVMVDWIGADSTNEHRWKKSQVVNRALPFLEEVVEEGVRSFVDCTPAYLGRDPLVLKMLADSTDLQIITNTGYYGAVNNKFLPEHTHSETADQLAERWINEYKNGIGTTGIRPGFIKISVSPDDSLSQLHRKLVRAAALTHKKTGLTIVSHSGPDVAALNQINVLTSEGVSASAFVWTHAQHGSFKGYLTAASQGAWISLDNVSSNPETIEWFVSTLKRAKNSGFFNQILISHDSGWYNVGEKNGGTFNGYTAIFSHLIPALLENGFTQNDIKQLLVDNPVRSLSIQKRLL